MNGIEIWIVPIVGGLIAMVIYEVLKAPIRRYLRKRTKKQEPRKRSQTARTDSEDVLQTEERMKGERKAKEIKETIRVKPGCHETKTLSLKQGNEISGLAEEVFGQDFSLYVVDKEGYSDFLNNESFHTLFEMEDRVATPFDLRIPESGKWYFVFDAYGKQLSREIEFECTVV